MRQRKHYTAEYKREAVKLVQGGLTAAQAGRELGIRGNLVGRWVREAEHDPVDAFPGQGKLKPQDAELERLRKENIRLKAERDLLKKATVHSMDQCNTRYSHANSRRSCNGETGQTWING